jgi:hypothetical protein
VTSCRAERQERGARLWIQANAAPHPTTARHEQVKCALTREPVARVSARRGSRQGALAWRRRRNHGIILSPRDEGFFSGPLMRRRGKSTTFGRPSKIAVVADETISCLNEQLPEAARVVVEGRLQVKSRSAFA